MRHLSLLVLVALAMPAAALELSLPIACSPGRDCWVVRYVDQAAGPEIADFRCGRLTGDAHDGTDFAVPDLASVSRGVAVLAAASGTVLGTRDGMPDVDVSSPGAASVKDRECGNGVVLDHGEGWQTQYCHLRRGSVAVVKGDRLRAGAVLGQVGMSGEASFPHLHLSVRRDDEELDPFTSQPAGAGCGKAGALLWDAGAAAVLDYDPMPITGVGLATGPVEADGLAQGLYDQDQLPATAPALVAWARTFAQARGDVMTLTVLGPDGQPVVQDARPAEKDRAFAFRFAGRKRGPEPWPVGTYRVTVEIRRGDLVRSTSREIEIQ